MKKVTLDWIDVCPNCHNTELSTVSETSNYVEDEQHVECTNCGLTGTVTVYDAETVAVFWDTED